MQENNNKKIILIILGVVGVIGLIIIGLLFIPVVITTSTVTNSMDRARQNSFKAYTNEVAVWFEEEYQLLRIEQSSDEFMDLCGVDGNLCESTVRLNEDVLNAAEVEVKDFDAKKSTVYIDKETGYACVKLVASNNGLYKELSNKEAYSTACSLD